MRRCCARRRAGASGWSRRLTPGFGDLRGVCSRAGEGSVLFDRRAARRRPGRSPESIARRRGVTLKLALAAVVVVGCGLCGAAMTRGEPAMAVAPRDGRRPRQLRVQIVLRSRSTARSQSGPAVRARGGSSGRASCAAEAWRRAWETAGRRGGRGTVCREDVRALERLFDRLGESGRAGSRRPSAPAWPPWRPPRKRRAARGGGPAVPPSGCWGLACRPADLRADGFVQSAAGGPDALPRNGRSFPGGWALRTARRGARHACSARSPAVRRAIQVRSAHKEERRWTSTFSSELPQSAYW